MYVKSNPGNIPLRLGIPTIHTQMMSRCVLLKPYALKIVTDICTSFLEALASFSPCHGYFDSNAWCFLFFLISSVILLSELLTTKYYWHMPCAPAVIMVITSHDCII